MIKIHKLEGFFHLEMLGAFVQGVEAPDYAMDDPCLHHFLQGQNRFFRAGTAGFTKISACA